MIVWKFVTQMVVQITHIIIRVLLFPPCGILARPMQITNMSFRLYNPDNLYAFQNIKSGQLRGTKGTSPPPQNKKIPNTTNLVQIWSFLAQKHRISNLVKHHGMVNLSEFFFEFWSGAIRITFSGLDCCGPEIEIRKQPECFFASVLCCLFCSVWFWCLNTLICMLLKGSSSTRRTREVGHAFRRR